jgi:formylmethanofuran dehydrogenase subunit E
MNICSYDYDEYVHQVKTFHGFGAPGVIIGGFMVDLAYKHLPGEGPFDVLCETVKCLPDAVQILTPCTIGNGWLTVINTGRYALTLYDKHTGKGVRVYVDHTKLDSWPEIKSWFFKLKPKTEQDGMLLVEQIKAAGAMICGTQNVQVADRFLKQMRRGGIAVCPLCKEAYPVATGAFCLACQGEALYLTFL